MDARIKNRHVKVSTCATMPSLGSSETSFGELN